MTGTYGTVKPSLINPQMDVEIWYHYRPTRNSEDEKKIKRYLSKKKRNSALKTINLSWEF